MRSSVLASALVFCACGGADAAAPAPATPTPAAPLAAQPATTICVVRAIVGAASYREPVAWPTDPVALDNELDYIAQRGLMQHTIVASRIANTLEVAPGDWTLDNAPPAYTRDEWEQLGGNEHGPTGPAEVLHYRYDYDGRLHSALARTSEDNEGVVYRYDYVQTCGENIAAAPDCCCDAGRDVVPELSTSVECGRRSGQCVYVASCFEHDVATERVLR